MNQKEQVISWLNDAYAMETSITKVLENHVKDAKDDPEMQSRLEIHLNETHRQAERLQSCIQQLGGSVSTTRSVLSQAMGKVQAVATGLFGDEQLKNALMDYSTEHFEIACYRSLIEAANELGAENVAAVARQNLEEEERMAEWLASRIGPLTRKVLEMEQAVA